MRLKEIVATYLYIRDNNNAVIDEFIRADSNTRDNYHKQAHRLIAKLCSSYFRLAPFGRLISGCVRDTLNSHGQITNASTIHSLTKRIVSRIPEYLRQGK